MKHRITFVPSAFDSYKEWATTDKIVFFKINELIQSIDRTPYHGIGKPEPLKHQLKGCWSRRITEEHRLVYQVKEPGEIIILQCKFHY
ncbi:MAG: Txe/YoeB family addiction module toxin [Bacteroidetes bacterium]|nr:Txe/YoeB family addiction module toxin [Bacteroidota bacterium]